jgi:cyclophilin family peptidyl-prolyl cis-trans isomerase/HEAT repeat protein
MMRALAAVLMIVLPAGIAPAKDKTSGPPLRKQALILQLEDERDAQSGEWKKLAADGDAAIRARAALALGRIGSEQSVPLLAALAKDEETGVRLTASFALGLVPGEGASKALAEVLSNPDLSPEETAQALESLGRVGLEEDASKVASFLDSPSPVVVEAALGALWRFSSFERVEKVMELATDADTEPAVRRAAALALGRRGPKEAYRTLSALAHDSDSRIVSYAILGLNRTENPEAPAQVQHLLEDSNQPVAVHAAALQLFADRSGRVEKRVLSELLHPDQHPYVFLTAAAALEKADTQTAMEFYEQFLELPHPEVVAVAVEAAGRAALPLVAKHGEELTKHPSWMVRRAVLRAAMDVKYDKEKTEGWARALLEDPDMRVEIQALETLGRLDVPDRYDMLMELVGKDKKSKKVKHPMRLRQVILELQRLLQDDMEHLATYIRTKISQWERKTINEALYRLYGEAPGGEGTVVRLSVLDALRDIQTPEALAFYEDMLASDPDLLVRRTAALHLGDITGDPYDAAQLPPAKRKRPSFYRRVLDRNAKRSEAVLRTEAGEIVLEFRPDDAPLTVHSFATLAGRGFYDGLPFHRVVPGFVVQTGCPWGAGLGGPGYHIRSEWSNLPFTRGTVGMAHSGKDTAGSQFFITQAPQPHLEAAYTVFGQVKKGMEVVDRITEGTRILSVEVR